MKAEDGLKTIKMEAESGPQIASAVLCMGKWIVK